MRLARSCHLWGNAPTNAPPRRFGAFSSRNCVTFEIFGSRICFRLSSPANHISRTSELSFDDWTVFSGSHLFDLTLGNRESWRAETPKWLRDKSFLRFKVRGITRKIDAVYGGELFGHGVRWYSAYARESLNRVRGQQIRPRNSDRASFSCSRRRRAVLLYHFSSLRSFL